MSDKYDILSSALLRMGIPLPLQGHPSKRVVGGKPLPSKMGMTLGPSLLSPLGDAEKLTTSELLRGINSTKTKIVPKPRQTYPTAASTGLAVPLLKNRSTIPVFTDKYSTAYSDDEDFKEFSKFYTDYPIDSPFRSEQLINKGAKTVTDIVRGDNPNPEKVKAFDKEKAGWLALAQAGFSLGANRRPDFLGALSEAGGVGIGAFIAQKKAYRDSQRDALKDSYMRALTGQARAVTEKSIAEAKRGGKLTGPAATMHYLMKVHGLPASQAREMTLGKTPKEIELDLYEYFHSISADSAEAKIQTKRAMEDLGYGPTRENSYLRWDPTQGLIKKTQ